MTVAVGTNHPPVVGVPLLYENRGLQFDGSDDSVAGPLLPAITDTFTFELWVKPTRTRGNSSEGTTGLASQFIGEFAVFPTHGDNVGWRPERRRGAGSRHEWLHRGRTCREFFSLAPSSNTARSDWTHVARGQYENKQPRLFVNGIPCAHRPGQPRTARPKHGVEYSAGALPGPDG